MYFVFLYIYIYIPRQNRHIAHAQVRFTGEVVQLAPTLYDAVCKAARPCVCPILSQRHRNARTLLNTGIPLVFKRISISS